MIEDGINNLAKHGEKDPIVVDEELLAAPVLDIGSEYDEADRECYSDPHNHLKLMSENPFAF